MDLHEKDTERWYREYGPYASHKGLAHLRLSQRPFSTTPVARALWRLGEALPTQGMSDAVNTMTMFLEPFLTRYPARGGRRGG